VTPVESVETVGWLVVGSGFTAGAGTLWLVWYLDRHRGAPGATWFMAALCSQVVWVFAYTAGLLVAAPALRRALEALSWVGLAWLGPLFLGFALAYTGRSDVVHSPWFPVVFVVPTVTTLLAVTLPGHSLLWRGFVPAPTFGLATVQYAVQPAGYVAVVSSLAVAGTGALLLVETVVSYGPLYRREAVAVALSTVPPSVGAVLWLFDAGPVPQLNLATVLFLPHVALDIYAFVGSNMFETNPTTQRAAQRGALNDLDDPLLVVDPDGRVVNRNARAEGLFGTGVELPCSVATLVGTDLDTLRSRGELTVASRDEVYAVSYTPLTDPAGTDVGAIVVFYDVTTVRRQKQRLSVLNRILRHNLRNQLTVAQGRAELVAADSDDPSIRAHAAAIQAANDRLLSIGERIREFQRVQARDRSPSTVDLTTVLDRVLEDVTARYPDARVEVSVTDDRPAETDADTLALVLSNLVENAIVHAEGDPVVELCLSGTDDAAVFEVRDHNDPIPDLEIDSLDAAEESALEHGQGIGLWVVTWCLDFLGGEATFDYDDGNVVTVTLPRGADRE